VPKPTTVNLKMLVLVPTRGKGMPASLLRKEIIGKIVPRTAEIADLVQRIKDGRYIIIFAPRQTGKTTFFQQLGHYLQPRRLAILLEQYTDEIWQTFAPKVSTNKRGQPFLVNRMAQCLTEELGIGRLRRKLSTGKLLYSCGTTKTV